MLICSWVCEYIFLHEEPYHPMLTIAAKQQARWTGFKVRYPLLFFLQSHKHTKQVYVDSKATMCLTPAMNPIPMMATLNATMNTTWTRPQTQTQFPHPNVDASNGPWTKPAHLPTSDYCHESNPEHHPNAIADTGTNPPSKCGRPKQDHEPNLHANLNQPAQGDKGVYWVVLGGALVGLHVFMHPSIDGGKGCTCWMQKPWLTIFHIAAIAALAALG